MPQQSLPLLMMMLRLLPLPLPMRLLFQVSLAVTLNQLTVLLVMLQ